MSLAARFNWTPDQINAMPLEFIEELFERFEAEAKIDKREREKIEAQRR